MAHHSTGASNGPVEATNLLIKEVKRSGRGFRTWLEADDGVEGMQEGIASMLDGSPWARRTGEHFIGEFGSREEFGAEQLEEMGFAVEDLEAVPEHLRPYVRVDVVGWVRDMELGGAISVVESLGGVCVFWK